MAIRAWLGLAATVVVAAGLVGLSRGYRQRTAADDPGVLIDQGLYERAESAARAHVAATTASYGDHSLASADAADVLVRALRLNGKASIGDTLILAERTLRDKQARLGERHPGTAASVLNLSLVLTDAGKHERAIALLQELLASRESRPGPDSLATAEVLDALGFTFTKARAYDRALQALDRSLRIKERRLPPKDAGIVTTLETTIEALQGKGDYREARTRLDRARSLDPVTAGTHPRQLTMLNLRAMQLWFEDSLSESRATSLDALALAERTLRPGHPDVARTLRILAATINYMGDVSAAATYRERALSIGQKSLGEDHPDVAGYLNDLAMTNFGLGNYVEARKQFERGLWITEKSAGPPEWIPMFVHNLALVDASLGDFPSARREQARATELWERTLGRDHPFVAVALTEFAAVLREQHAAGDALPLLERALAIRERALGSGHRDTAHTMADIAATLAQLGQQNPAQAMAVRALRIWERTDTQDIPELATVLELYAVLQMSRGGFAEAQRYFARALAIRQKIFGVSHPQVADLQLGLALAQAKLAQGREALSTALQADTIGREHLRLMVRYLPERQSLNYAASRRKGLDLILSLTGTGVSSGVALDALIRSRALVLDEMAARRHVATAPGDGVAPLQEGLRAARQRLANLVVRGPSGQPPERYVALVAEARSQKEGAERLLAEHSAAFRAELGQAQAGLHDVRNAIPPDGAVVSFVRFDRISGVAARPGSASGSPENAAVPSYLGFVVRLDRPPVTIPLGDAGTIERLVAAWRSEIVADRTRRPGEGRSLRTAGLRLRKAVWDRLAPHLEGIRTVFIVPDGALNLVPFAALPGDNAEFLIEETPPLHYLAAERDLVARAGPSPARGLLALGGASFDAEMSKPAPPPRNERDTPTRSIGEHRAGSACQAFDSLRFQPLTGTLEEVRQIAGLWNGPGVASTEDVRLLMADEANEATFKQEAPRHRVLHLATHGFFLGGPCLDQRAGLRAVGGLVARTDAAPAIDNAALNVSESPLLFSGMALAGANHRAVAAAGDEDGILTAEEVAALTLEDVEWAVLSACDTGVGEVRAGEGVFGLRRAFQVAGARTVIMSLWSVDDEATRVWMRELYDGRLNRHLNTIDAMREASLTVLQARRSLGQSTHPFYWAAFVAAGDWH